MNEWTKEENGKKLGTKKERNETFSFVHTDRTKQLKCEKRTSKEQRMEGMNDG